MPKTLADFARSFGPVSPEQLKSWFADLRKVVKVGQTLSRWFPGRVPPGPINAASEFLDLVEPYLDDPELASAINFTLDLLRLSTTRVELHDKNGQFIGLRRAAEALNAAMQPHKFVKAIEPDGSYSWHCTAYEKPQATVTTYDQPLSQFDAARIFPNPK